MISQLSCHEVTGAIPASSLSLVKWVLYVQWVDTPRYSAVDHRDLEPGSRPIVLSKAVISCLHRLDLQGLDMSLFNQLFNYRASLAISTIYASCRSYELGRGVKG